MDKFDEYLNNKVEMESEKFILPKSFEDKIEETLESLDKKNLEKEEKWYFNKNIWITVACFAFISLTVLVTNKNNNETTNDLIRMSSEMDNNSSIVSYNNAESGSIREYSSNESVEEQLESNININDSFIDYNNINKILYKIPEANGVKTGYTGQAGKCLVSSIKHAGRNIVIVVLNCSDRWNVTEQIYKYVIDNYPEEMQFFNNFVDKGLLDRLNNVINSDFARISYTDAVAELEKHNDEFEYKVSWGVDLQTEHERYLCEKIFQKPVFVTDYPKEIKAFYMKLNDDGKTVAAADLLAPGIGEIIGGSQREDDYDKLLARIKELNMPLENYDWYLDLRKYGSCKHAGFGLGFERAIMYLTGMQNIRDVIPFPRTPNNCEF